MKNCFARYRNISVGGAQKMQLVFSSWLAREAWTLAHQTDRRMKPKRGQRSEAKRSIQMARADKGDVGGENAKVPDAAIQGEQAGKRNREFQQSGSMPPPAGESRPEGADPREAQLHKVNPAARQKSRSS